MRSYLVCPVLAELRVIIDQCGEEGSLRDLGELVEFL
jgi:hypothetical protein